MLRTRFLTESIKRFTTNVRQRCSDKIQSSEEVKTEKSPKETEEKPFKLPDEPENCCMSGCENCVWIQYAKELTDMYNDSGETAKKILLEKIKDPTMQVFLRMELSSLEKKSGS